MKNAKTGKLKKILKIILALLMIFAALFLFINVYVVKANENLINANTNDQKFDCVLILGAKVYESGSPSPILKNRLDRGIDLYFAKKADKIIVSGDHGQDNYDEVNAMKAYCIEKGVPSEDVFMDHAGFSTYESMVRAKDVFCCKSVLIVSQKYHLYRALHIANSIGLTAYGEAAEDISSGQKTRELRETFARVKDTATVIFKIKPTYSGESIPISGSGDITNDK